MNENKQNRPRASTIGTPVCHRKKRLERRQDLLEELAGVVDQLNGPYDYYDKGVYAFRQKIKSIREAAMSKVPKVFLAMWVREMLSTIDSTGKLRSRVHPIVPGISMPLFAMRREEYAKRVSAKCQPVPKCSLPGTQIESLCLGRMQMLIA